MTIQINNLNQTSTAVPPGMPRGVTFGLRRYAVTSKVRQLADIVLDNSGSFRGQKAKDASAAFRGLNEVLAEPANRDAFDIAVVTFGDQAVVKLPITKATEAAAILGSKDVVDGSAGYTNFEAALTHNESQIREALAREGVQQLRPVTLFFTDGRITRGGDPFPIAERIKQLADLVTLAFGSDADEDLLRRLATSPQHFYRVKDGRELRQFFAQVGKTMSQAIGTGRPATDALGALGK